jgi:Domain of unknown function (DUF4214)
MNLKIIAGLVITAGLLMGCGMTTTPVPETQISKPVTTRAQNYTANFAQNYVDALLRTYGVTSTTFGLEQTRASAIAGLQSGQITPSTLRDSLLDPLVGRNIYWSSSFPNLGSPENYVDFLYQNYLFRSGPEGRDYWAGMLRGVYGPVMTPSQVRDAFIDSQEYKLRFSTDQFIDYLFRQVLRRAISFEERQPWVNYLNATGLSRSSTIRIFLDTAEFANCQFINMSTIFETLWTRAAGFIYPGPFGPPSRCS